MEQTAKINLISTKTELPQQLVAITSHLRRVGIGAVLLSLGLGLFLGVGVAVLRLRVAALGNQREELVTRIKSAFRKESIYSVLAKQSAVAAKVLASFEPWERVVDQVTTIAPGTTFSSAAVNEKQELTLTAATFTIAEAAAVVERISDATSRKLIRSATMESLELGTDGNVRLVIRFTPTL